MTESSSLFESDPFAQSPRQRSADGRACFLALRQQLLQPLAMTAHEAACILSGQSPEQRPLSLEDFLRWHERRQACRAGERVRALAHQSAKRATAILEHALRQGGVRLIGNDGQAVFLALFSTVDNDAPSRTQQLVVGFTNRMKAAHCWQRWSNHTATRASRAHIAAGDQSFRDLLDAWCPTWRDLASDELEKEFEISDKTLMGYVEGRSMPSHATVDILAHVLCVEPEEVVAACRRSQADADCDGIRTLGAWRRLREMTLEAVAVAANVCVPSLRKYEAGAIPHHKQAKTRLAKALGIGVRQIAWGEVDQAPATVEANGSSAHHPLKNVT